jgi:hypothetical protein
MTDMHFLNVKIAPAIHYGIPGAWKRPGIDDVAAHLYYFMYCLHLLRSLFFKKIQI